MHKGYTLNYFIDFFKNIPDHRWTEGSLAREGTVQKCALGHAGSRVNGKTTSEYDINDGNARCVALEDFLNGKTVSINDAGPSSKFYKLGATPRGRILRALRNRKRTGNVFGTSSN